MPLENISLKNFIKNGETAVVYVTKINGTVIKNQGRGLYYRSHSDRKRLSVASSKQNPSPVPLNRPNDLCLDADETRPKPDEDFASGTLVTFGIKKSVTSSLTERACLHVSVRAIILIFC